MDHSVRTPMAWLPLPRALVGTFNWQIDVGDGRLIRLRDLSLEAFTSKLTKNDIRELWAAVYPALKEQLLRHRLPESLLVLAVRADQRAAVQKHASARGRKIPQQTILMRDALPYIGGRVGRLLRCLPREDFGEAAAVARQLVTITRPAGVAASDLWKKSMKGRRQKTSIEAMNFAWPLRRLQYSEDAYVLGHAGVRISCRDPRCGRLLVQIAHYVVLSGQSIEELEALTKHSDELADLVAQFRHLIEEIDRATVASEIRSLAAALLPPRTDNNAARYLACDLLAAHFGVGGEHPAAEVCGRFGIVRARIYQQVQTFSHRLGQTTFYSPALTKLRAAIEIGGARSLAPLLGDMSLRSALHFGARCLRWQVPAGESSSKRDDRARIEHVRALARTMARRSIAFYVPAIVVEMRRAHGVAMSADEVSDALSGEVTWLVSNREWASFAMEPLPLGVLQILACAAPHPVDVRELAIGLAHSKPWNSGAPSQSLRTEPFPTPALIKRALTVRGDVRKVRHNDFVLCRRLDPLSTLRTARESKVYEVLKANSGFLSAEEVRAADPSLAADLKHCLRTCKPWLACVAHSMYG